MLSSIINWIRPNVKTPIYDSMCNRLTKLQTDIKDLRKDLKYEKDVLLKEIKKKDLIIQTMINQSPDMFWCKDTSGKYMFANKAIKDNLLCDDDVIGKTDIQLAKQAKKTYGEDNHTFGDMCLNSDKDTIDNKYINKEYVESGKVRGKMLHLSVKKSIVVLNNEIIGVVGSGRDITDYRENLIRNNQEDIFKVNEFINKDIQWAMNGTGEIEEVAH